MEYTKDILIMHINEWRNEIRWHEERNMVGSESYQLALHELEYYEKKMEELECESKN